MLLRRLPLAAALLVALAAAPRPAAAAPALGLGADYLVDPGDGAFLLTLALETPVTRRVTLGGRFGAALVADPARVGVPLDARLRLRAGGAYVDGLVGPWIFFDDDDAVRLHAAFGFGLIRRGVSFGVEVGYLDPTATVGLRLAFSL
jgi:hypothetical protein